MKFFKKNILNFLILTLGFFIILLTLWITKTFGKNVYYVEILYNIHIGYEGFKDSPNEYNAKLSYEEMMNKINGKEKKKKKLIYFVSTVSAIALIAASYS